jgi:galactose oxidase
MRRLLCSLMLLIGGTLILSVNLTFPYHVLPGVATVSAAAQSAPLINLALNQSATQSSTDTVNGIVTSANLAVDGNTNGDISAGSVAQTLTEVRPWWEVDLGAVGYIDTIQFYNRTDCCAFESTIAYVLVSDVPFVSHDLNTTLNQPEVSRFLWPIFSTSPLPVGQTGRYVRIQRYGDSATVLHLAEVQVLGIPLPTAPAVGGQWSRIQPDLPDIPVHISLLPSGKLLFWGRDKDTVDRGPNSEDDVEFGCNTYLWDPSKTDDPSTPQDDRVVLIRNSRTNLFCSGHSFLANGNLFVAGGAETAVDAAGNKHYEIDGNGPRDTNIFDYVAETWRAGPSMNQRRWYPSVLTLSNGETLIVTGDYVSGFDNFNRPVRAVNRDTEILDVLQNLRTTPNGMPVELPNYPLLCLGPDGNILVVSGTNNNGLSYSPSTNTWVDPSNLDLNESHDQGTSVMYDKGKIMAIGGRQGGTAVGHDTEFIDLNLANPSWIAGNPMHYQRYYATSVLMPDGEVFIIGGSRCGGADNLQDTDPNGCRYGAIMDPEIYNPATGVWSIMSRQQIIRMYHSVALLMPDARILVAGGGRPGAYGETLPLGYDKYFAHREAELFSPPYLFNSDGTPATRPAIISSPPSITYGQSFSVGIGNVGATQIQQVVLVRLPSVTHTLNFDQRRVVLSGTPVNQQTLTVTAPANGIECPPGPYMLFALGPNRVPSVSKIIFVGSPGGPTPAPSGLLAAAISNAQVNVTWTASGGTVDHYEVDRKQSMSAPFVKIANVASASTSFTDLSVTGSVAYLYQVRAVSSSGSSSPPSNMDLATTVGFSDNQLKQTVAVIKAQHISELRIAVNAVRATAGLPPAVWTDSSLPGIPVKAVHITELRQNLQQALQALGLAIPSYRRSPLTPGLIVKGVDVNEIRQVIR